METSATVNASSMPSGPKRSFVSFLQNRWGYRISANSYPGPGWENQSNQSPKWNPSSWSNQRQKESSGRGRVQSEKLYTVSIETACLSISISLSEVDDIIFQVRALFAWLRVVMLCILHRWSAPVSPVIQSYRRDTFMRMLEKCVNARNEILARESIFSPFSMGNSIRVPKARWLHSTYVQFLYVRRIHRPWASCPAIRMSVLDPKFLLLESSLQLGTRVRKWKCKLINSSSRIYYSHEFTTPRFLLFILKLKVFH